MYIQIQQHLYVFTPHHPCLCSVGGVIAAGGLLPACGHPNCDSRGSFPGPALCRVCEEGHGPDQHCCHDGGRCCLCWPYHRRSVSQTMHRLATELHNAQCTVACTALQLSCTVHSAMHSTAQHSTAQTWSFTECFLILCGDPDRCDC